MTSPDRTEKSQSERIRFEFDLAHPPEKVWRALTDPVLLAEWLLPVFDLELEPEAAFRFKTDAMPGWDGTVHCRMISVEPLKTLTYTWLVGDMDTVVSFTLTPTESGTRLVLVHSGFKPEQKRNFGGARYGWRLMGDKLVELLERIT